MKFLKIIFFIAIVLGLASCKKEPFDPARNNQLIYVKPVYLKATIINATIDGQAWKGTGKAIVDSSSIEIFGQADGKKIYFKLKDFKTQTIFKIAQGLDSATINKSGATASLMNDFSENSKVTIVRLDTISKQIEGNFEFELATASKEKTTISKGYFKIDYSEVFMKAIFLNGKQSWQADTVWTKIDSTKDPMVINIFGKHLSSDSTINLSLLLLEAPFFKMTFKDSQPPSALVITKKIEYKNQKGGNLILRYNSKQRIITGTFNFQLEESFEAVDLGRFSVSY